MGYRRLVDAIEAQLADKPDLNMPEPTIMGYSLDDCKRLAAP